MKEELKKIIEKEAEEYSKTTDVWYDEQKAFSAGIEEAINNPSKYGLVIKEEISEFNEIDKARFWSKVELTDYCWAWKANKDSNGYGMFKINGKDQKASRVAYKIIYGEIPESLHVLHKCDNPSCINPDHLFTGTHQDNMHDKMRKGRGKVLGRASRYHGVAFRKDSNNWRAQLFDGRKHISLGSFKTEEEAARKRDDEVIRLNLDLPLNFPLQSQEGLDGMFDARVLDLNTTETNLQATELENAKKKIERAAKLEVIDDMIVDSQQKEIENLKIELESIRTAYYQLLNV